MTINFFCSLDFTRSFREGLGARRTAHMADSRPSRRGGVADASKVYSYVDVLRTLKRSINKGGTLYSAASPCLHTTRTLLID